MKVVEIQNLTKDYETGFWKKTKVRALDGLSLEVVSGQIFGFLGGNGAGKTTTIKILMSLLFPTSGSAKILGRDISETEMRTRIGYCPENPYFYDYLTAYELMIYFGELLGLPTAERKKRAEELLNRVGLDEKAWNRQLRKFSKGMLQRVGLAQSLINAPEIVFLDEPMSGLDPIGRREVRELISGLREAGTTVFMSTHILSDVEALCDEVAILTKGKLTARGKLDELLSSETRTFEIQLKGLVADRLSRLVADKPGVVVHDRGSVTLVEVPDESVVTDVVDTALSIGGHLISVQNARQSLEDLFVTSTGKEMTAGVREESSPVAEEVVETV